ncbi:SWI/SNF-related matrix-associated actin-dependent regulator of chromatin subfamily E member 1 [Toxocara canis]|uniref:SWI/SNF-related matrix-associated actin-dependent regulator of chromatin subfamily E member 1 n=1 Tax=Toxocara canis TaxID=6265 RepID=A0A0B2VAV9_TOXCA|nr:SWI/SNF-related matrix-associated actin-dependent regulator of chromatin subfamily E member 1 [Toxocara canis]
MFRHPNSTPSRPSGQDAGSLKPPKAPDRPLVPYMRFSRKMWAKVRSEHPDSQLWDIGKVIGQMWRDAPESEKAVYQQEYEIEKTEYEKALKAYHNSTAYQQYLSAKNRAKMADKSNTVGGVIASGRGRLDTGGVVIQPVEDEEVGDLSSRRVAAVRFDRNHRLIAELFNGNVVTDTRTIVAQSRIDMLQKQAHSLALHQSKLEDELKKLNDVFQEKKRQMETSSEEFAARLKKVCEDKPQVDETKYASMVEEWSSKMLRAYEDYKAKQEAIRAKQLVEREQLAEETPILYSLTVGDTSPSPKRKETDDKSPVNTTEDKDKEDESESAEITEETEKPIEEDRNNEKTETEEQQPSAEEESQPQEVAPPVTEDAATE